jgi:hypothetical protein
VLIYPPGIAGREIGSGKDSNDTRSARLNAEQMQKERDKEFIDVKTKLSQNYSFIIP